MAARKKKATIAHGSIEHRAILGIDRQTDPEEKAKLEQALATKPEPPENAKRPITKREYDRDEVIVDGWARRSD